MKISLRFISYCIASVYVGFGNNIVIYIIYFLFSIYDLANIIKNSDKEKRKKALLYISVYSVILPDNYISIAAICFCILVDYKRTKIKSNIFSILFVLYIIGQTIFHINHYYNILFSGLFWSVFVLSLLVGKNFYSSFNIEAVKQIFKEVIIIQWIPVLVIAVFQSGFKYNDLDWVTGTFGLADGVQLFITFVFIGTFFLMIYFQTKEFSDLLYAVLSLVIGIMTGSIAITLIYLCSVFIYIFIIASGIRKKLLTFLMMLGIIFVLFISNNEWVKEDILNLTNKNYFQSRVEKIETYRITFFEIPKNDYLFFLVGEGIGRYSSRAALTMTGNYLEFEKKSDMSEYTGQYIYPLFYRAQQQNIGTAYMPYTEICVIQGETGIIGMILSIILFERLYRRSNKNQRFILITIFLLLFYDNYLEFPKVAFIFIMIYRLLGYKGLEVVKNERGI